MFNFLVVEQIQGIVIIDQLIPLVKFIRLTLTKTVLSVKLSESKVLIIQHVRC